MYTVWGKERIKERKNMSKLGVVAHTCNLSHQRITVNSRQVWATKLETASEKEEEKSAEEVKKEEEKGKR